MGVLGQMYRLLTVAGPHDADKASERRPLQLRLNDARRELDVTLREGRPDAAHLRLLVQEMERTFELRNTHARLLEEQDQEDAAMEIYESNVTDMFADSFPYERLLDIRLQGARTSRSRHAEAIAKVSESMMLEQVRRDGLNRPGIRGGCLV